MKDLFPSDGGSLEMCRHLKMAIRALPHFLAAGEDVALVSSWLRKERRSDSSDGRIGH